jgi:hypothetical protein
MSRFECLRQGKVFGIWMSGVLTSHNENLFRINTKAMAIQKCISMMNSACTYGLNAIFLSVHDFQYTYFCTLLVTLRLVLLKL